MGVWKRRVAGSWVEQSGLVAGSASALGAYEFYRWQVRAALLDPAAYTWLSGSGATSTVPTGETWYVVSGWRIDTGTPTAYHRVPDARNGNAYALSEGETITLDAHASSYAYICKPEAVIATDVRYGDDPKGLLHERLYRLDADLAHYDLGHNNTGSTQVTSSFPTDFTDGMVVHYSAHDIAWGGLLHTGGAAMNLDNEISDANQIRFAQAVTLPFVRTDFPSIMSQGVSQAEGSLNVRYVKLPVDW